VACRRTEPSMRLQISRASQVGGLHCDRPVSELLGNQRGVISSNAVFGPGVSGHFGVLPTTRSCDFPARCLARRFGACRDRAKTSCIYALR